MQTSSPEQVPVPPPAPAPVSATVPDPPTVSQQQLRKVREQRRRKLRQVWRGLTPTINKRIVRVQLQERHEELLDAEVFGLQSSSRYSFDFASYVESVLAKRELYLLLGHVNWWHCCYCECLYLCFCPKFNTTTVTTDYYNVMYVTSHTSYFPFATNVGTFGLT